MISPVFKTKSGQLTPYALACGYIEQVEENEVRTTLWKEGCYHVRQHDFKEKGRIFWDSFTKLTDARRDLIRLKEQ
jgi:hypothetical protein